MPRTFLGAGFLLFFFLACRENISYFGFYLMDPVALSPVQEKYFSPRRFVRYTPPIYFPEGKIIWYSYFSDLLREVEFYTVVLFRKSLGWIERRVERIALREGEVTLVGFYEDLEEGEYLLRVYEAGRRLGEIIFHIIPPSAEGL